MWYLPDNKLFIGGRCISGGRFWGGKGLESEKGVLEEKELLGVNIIGVFLPEELTITVDFYNSHNFSYVHASTLWC